MCNHSCCRAKLEKNTNKLKTFANQRKKHSQLQLLLMEKRCADLQTAFWNPWSETETASWPTLTKTENIFRHSPMFLFSGRPCLFSLFLLLFVLFLVFFIFLYFFFFEYWFAMSLVMFGVLLVQEKWRHTWRQKNVTNMTPKRL